MGHRRVLLLVVGHLILRTVLDATPARAAEPREHAAHVRERLLHPGQGVVGVDLVLEVDVAREAHRLELPEDFGDRDRALRSEEHTSELQSHLNLVCRLLLEQNNITNTYGHAPTCFPTPT